MQVRIAAPGETIVLRKQLDTDSSKYVSKCVCNGEKACKVPSAITVVDNYVEFVYNVDDDWVGGSYVFVVEKEDINVGVCYVRIEKQGLVIEL